MWSCESFQIAWPGAVLAAVVGALAPNPSLAIAPSPVASASAGVAGGDAGAAGATIDGHIDAIDYKSGAMTLDVGDGGAHKTLAILVVAGTNIVGKKDFYTIADLKRGAHVQVLVSRRGSTNTAQIIHLL